MNSSPIEHLIRQRGPLVDIHQLRVTLRPEVALGWDFSGIPYPKSRDFRAFSQKNPK